MTRMIATVALAGALTASCSTMPPVQEHTGMSHHDMDHKGMETAPRTAMPLLTNLGTHVHRISTRNAKAQAYFDQGYRLLFNFNHAGAISSFEEALKLDPECAMCWWGISLAHGPNINMPMMPEANAPALHALEMAQALKAKAGEAERAYIDALSSRYSADPSAERSTLDRAFAEAMRKVAQRFPQDLDAQVLYAEALMDTSPWDYWQADKSTPKAGMEDLVPTLERVLKRAPRHPGAIHLYIHAVEASATPSRAERYADRLAALLPGAGHLVHMPSHIYNRIGRYNDGVVWNQNAAKADEDYFAVTNDRGMYAGMYYVHNLHFVWTAATNDGRSALARDYAHKVVANLDPDMLRKFPSAEIFAPTELYAWLRFGDYDQVLAAPAPDPSLHFATAIWHYARARALAAKNDLASASAESGLIARSFSESDGQHFLDFGVPGSDLVRIAGHVARAEIARLRKDANDEVNELKAAVQAQDSLAYTEPPYWDFPVRGFLGAALVRAGRLAEAIDVYRADLKEWPRNGWSLFGLSLALDASGRHREAASVRTQFRTTWKRADVVLSESRF